MVDFDTFALRSDPADLGLSFDQIVIPGPLGDYPAWELPGTDDTWVVFVHDRGTSRREALRLLFSVNLAGYPSLVITYRNDKGAPASQAGRHALGEDEWEDLEAAVDHVLISGGVDVVIVGHGMGTALASTFVHNSELGHRVQGLIFDAPLLQPGSSWTTWRLSVASPVSCRDGRRPWPPGAGVSIGGPSTRYFGPRSSRPRS